MSAPQYEWSMWHREMERRNPEGTERHTMTKDERMRFLRAWNDAPPITDANPERIEMFWIKSNLLLVAVIFVENGCVTYTALMERQLVEAIISPNTNGYERPFNPMDREA